MLKRKQNLKLRASIINAIREFFFSRDFLEVETPLRIPANAPEEYIDPYGSENFYLQTSPEVCMKRLLCRGHERIFQISRCWRRSERGSRHLPEFTMLEWYRSDSDYLQLMNDCDELLAFVSGRCGGDDGILFKGNNYYPARPAERITVRESFERFSSREMREAVELGCFDTCMVEEIEPALSGSSPIILMDYPAQMAALSRIKADNPEVAERFELYLGGLELANGFSELNNPEEQRKRFMLANAGRAGIGLPELPVPEPFLNELGHMPPSAGIALGVDRLVMLFADAEQIDDVVAFTTEEL
jgi:elongation factor P--(R)-beta-lysine ligase